MAQNNLLSREYGDRTTMSTFTKLTYHIVFATKHRTKSITNPWRERLYEYIGGILRAKNGQLLEIGGIEDHVHILATLPPTKAISDTIRDIKTNASKWKNELPGNMGLFEWQKGYGAFTVSYSQLEIVRHYIQNQKENHRTKTFEEEYVGFLKLHNISFNNKYLFEEEHFG